LGVDPFSALVSIYINGLNRKQINLRKYLQSQLAMVEMEMSALAPKLPLLVPDLDIGKAVAAASNPKASSAIVWTLGFSHQVSARTRIITELNRINIKDRFDS
jgi:hypothetical protein